MPAKLFDVSGFWMINVVGVGKETDLLSIVLFLHKTCLRFLGRYIWQGRRLYKTYIIVEFINLVYNIRIHKYLFVLFLSFQNICGQSLSLSFCMNQKIMHSASNIGAIPRTPLPFLQLSYH